MALSTSGCKRQRAEDALDEISRQVKIPHVLLASATVALIMYMFAWPG
jgi:hypothetical protein